MELGEMNTIIPNAQMGALPRMNQYTMTGTTVIGVLAGAILGPPLMGMLAGTGESPAAAVTRNLAPMLLGAAIGGALMGGMSGGLWLYQRG
jgi:formate/nitrite transporter FocA (FNT family)